MLYKTTEGSTLQKMHWAIASNQIKHARYYSRVLTDLLWSIATIDTSYSQEHQRQNSRMQRYTEKAEVKD